MSVWNTTGLNSWQREPVEEIIISCTFPWLKLWPEIFKTRGTKIPVKSSDLSRFRQMFSEGEHHVHDEEREGHIISIGRNQVLGIFWSDGQIEIEQTIDDPQLIKEIFLAEAAHSVDYFLPLSDLQKIEITKLFHGGNIDAHTWWEIQDYGAEYYSLIGESFMALFTLAYSNIIPWQDSFIHKATPSMIPKVYEILGVEPEQEDLPEELPTVTKTWLEELIDKLINWFKRLFK